MAWIEDATGVVTVRDAAQRISTVRFNVSTAEAKNYVAAADQTARDATAVGTLLAAVRDATGGEKLFEGVQFGAYDDTETTPAKDSQFLRGNKWTVKYQAGGEKYQFTIPARSAVVPGTVFETDGISLDLTAGLGLQLKTAADAVLLSKYGEAGTVYAIQAND